MLWKLTFLSCSLVRYTPYLIVQWEMQAYFGSVEFKQFVWKQSVRYVDIRAVFVLFQPGYFFFTLDLKSGYHHVKICPDHRQYLGFSWRFDSVVKYFVFTVLPFGLSSAPYIFTKLVHAPLCCWGGLGRRVVTFLDDGIGGASDFIACLEVSRLCRAVLEMAGFFVNDQESMWTSSHVGAWLGYCLGFSRFISMRVLKLQSSREASRASFLNVS